MKTIKLITLILFIASIGLMSYGFILASEEGNKYIGSGVLVLFLLVFPLFSYYRWKGKDIKDYMLTQENLDKMRESQKKRKF